MLVSVIIPTYNRASTLRRTLDSLARQTLPPDQYEVIVVDDGSPNFVEPWPDTAYPASLRCVRQANQGATQARNTGAQASRGAVLVFVDDDITVSPETLADLAALCTAQAQTIALGTLVPAPGEQQPVFARLNAQGGPRAADNGSVHFANCMTGLLAVRREDFFALGMFQDPGGGWPNWDDVDFGYRAHQRGFRLCRSQRAIGQHWDYALNDLATACRRWQRAARAAVWLFHKHPEVQSHVPMFRDMTPPVWSQDPPRLLLRKLARRLAATRPVVWGLERSARWLERFYAAPALLRPLYRWIIGSYIYRGYQQGLKDYA